MTIAAYKDDSATISTTEYSLVNDSTSLATDTTDGIYQVFLDLSAMTVTEQYQIKVYEKCYSAGSKLVIYESIVTGTSAPTWVSPSLVLLYGWDVTVKKLAGTDRTIGWSIRQVA